MPKGPNHDIGECPCPVEGCGSVAFIRRQKNHEQGALFINCGTHRQQPSAWLNEYIANKGRFYPPGASPGDEAGQGEGLKPGQELTPGEAVKKPDGARHGQEQGKPSRGFWDWFNDWEL